MTRHNSTNDNNNNDMQGNKSVSQSQELSKQEYHLMIKNIFLCQSQPNKEKSLIKITQAQFTFVAIKKKTLMNICKLKSN